MADPALGSFDPSNFPGNPNPPPQIPDAPTKTMAPVAYPATSAGTGALPPASNLAGGGGFSPPPQASESPQYSVVQSSDGSLNGFADTKDGPVRLLHVNGPEAARVFHTDDVAKVLGQVAHYDDATKTWSGVPEDTIKALGQGRPAMPDYWKQQFDLSEEEAVKGANAEAVLAGKMTPEQYLNATHLETLKEQLANRPDMAWFGKAGIIADAIHDPSRMVESVGGSVAGSGKALVDLMAEVAKDAMIGSMGGGIAGSAVPVVGTTTGASLGGWLGGYKAFYDMQRRSTAARMLDQGYDVDTVRKTSAVAGTLSAALMMGSFGLLSPLAKAAFLDKLAASKVVQRALANWLVKSAGTGAGVMAAQGTIDEMLNNIVAHVKERPELLDDPKTAIMNIMDAAIKGATFGTVVGGGFKLLGKAFATLPAEEQASPEGKKVLASLNRGEKEGVEEVVKRHLTVQGPQESQVLPQETEQSHPASGPSVQEKPLGSPEQTPSVSLSRPEESTPVSEKTREGASTSSSSSSVGENSIAEKVLNVEIRARITKLNSDLDAVEQRIDDLVQERKAFSEGGTTHASKVVDANLREALIEKAGIERDIEYYKTEGAEKPTPLEPLQMKPATLENIVEAGFKEGGKQSQARAKELLAIAKENKLTGADVRALIGRKAIGAMTNLEYKNFLEGVDRVVSEQGDVGRERGFKERVQDLVEKKQARMELQSILNEKQLKKERYVRQLHQMPALADMTTTQLKQYAEILRQYDKADVALSPKRIAALEGTKLEGVKTEGEVRARLSEFTGQPIEDFKNVKISAWARFIPEPQLRNWMPSLKPIIDASAAYELRGDALAYAVDERQKDLATAAIKEQHAAAGMGARIADFFAPQQRDVMTFLEAKTPEDVANSAAALGPAQLKWAEYLKEWFEQANEYLTKKEGMASRFEDSYAPHVNKSYAEIVRDAGRVGLWNTLKELMPHATKQSGDFVDNNGQVLGFNKYFKQAAFRSGELDPSRNVVMAASRYIHDFYNKVALDQATPYIDTMVKAMETKNPDEQQFASSLQSYTKDFLNNQKGINTTFGYGGQLIAPALDMAQSLASIHWIAAHFALQAIKAGVAIPISEFMAINLPKAEMLRWTKKGQTFLRNSKFITEKGVFEALGEPGRGLGDYTEATAYGGFQWAHQRAMGNVLLASATSEELAAGKMSEARVNEVMQKAGRWMDVSGQGSIAGGSSIGRTFTQFKKWAIPPTLTIGEDLVSLGKTIGTLGKTRMTAQQVQETLKLGAMGVIAVYTGSVLHKDEENDSFKGQTIHYLRRVVGSMWRGLDPAFFLGAAGPAYIVKLGMDLHLLGTLEEYKKGPHEGENKGKIALERDLIPRFVKDVMRAVEPEEQESEKDKSPSQF